MLLLTLRPLTMASTMDWVARPARARVPLPSVCGRLWGEGAGATIAFKVAIQGCCFGFASTRECGPEFRFLLLVDG